MGWDDIVLLNYLTILLIGLSISGNLPVNNEYQAIHPLRIAVIEPVFTSTAYSTFYDFYATYKSTLANQTVTTNLDWLNTSIVHDWSLRGTFDYINSSDAKARGLVLGDNVHVLTDINVSQGAVFNGTRRNYDVLIESFAEYVTSTEYLAFRRFVDSGGIIIFMDADSPMVEVAYHAGSDHLSLVRGHSWAFNGTAARRDVMDRWLNESQDWIGSNYWINGFGKTYNGSIAQSDNPIGRALLAKYGTQVFTTYHGAEENYISNFTETSITAKFIQVSDDGVHTVAAYLHRHLRGYVSYFGGFGSLVISRDKSVQDFLVYSVLFAAMQNSSPLSLLPFTPMLIIPMLLVNIRVRRIRTS